MDAAAIKVIQDLGKLLEELKTRERALELRIEKLEEKATGLAGGLT